MRLTIVILMDFAAFNGYLNGSGPDGVQVVVSDEFSFVYVGVHGADIDLFACLELDSTGCRGFRIQVPSYDGITGACKRVAALKTGLFVPLIIVAVVVVQNIFLSIAFIIRMIGYRGIRHAAGPKSVQNDVELAVVSGLKKLLVIYGERVAGLMEVVHEIDPSGKLKFIVSIGGRSVYYDYGTVLNIFVIILESALSAFAENVLNVDVSVETPFGGQMKDVIIVLILLVVDRAFVAKILGNGIGKVPRVSCRIEPAYQGVARTCGIEHVSVVDHRPVCRPEVQRLIAVHYGVVRAEIQPYVIRDADPDGVHAESLSRHGLCAPVYCIVGVMLSRSERPAAEGIAGGIRRLQFIILVAVLVSVIRKVRAVEHAVGPLDAVAVYELQRYCIPLIVEVDGAVVAGLNGEAVGKSSSAGFGLTVSVKAVGYSSEIDVFRIGPYGRARASQIERGTVRVGGPGSVRVLEYIDLSECSGFAVSIEDLIRCQFFLHFRVIIAGSVMILIITVFVGDEPRIVARPGIAQIRKGLAVQTRKRAVGFFCPVAIVIIRVGAPAGSLSAGQSVKMYGN